MKQIRFLGLGGQGVVTGAKLFSEAVVTQGTYAQTTPAYGHERRGAPVSADVFASDSRSSPSVLFLSRTSWCCLAPGCWRTAWT